MTIESTTPAPAPGGAPTHRGNAAVAQMLREMADLLQAQGDPNPFRSAAYRRAADTVASSPVSVVELFERDGLSALDALPGIGPGIAAAIAEFAHTGRWTRLERLRGTSEPLALLRTIPGVGPQLAARLHDELGVDTLEELELAAHDGRLERLPKFGARRAAAIRAALTQMLDRARSLVHPWAFGPVPPRGNEPFRAAGQGSFRRPRAAPSSQPQVPLDVLLDVDRQYRAAAAAGQLPKISTRRFNPEGKPWLPVLHTRRGAHSVTALYSNTARAHELGRTHDWVVVYVEDAGHRERQYTVVTSTHGPLVGRRVVRGREDECLAWYARAAAVPRSATPA